VIINGVILGSVANNIGLQPPSVVNTIPNSVTDINLGQTPLLGGIPDIYSSFRMTYLAHQTVDPTGVFSPDDVLFGKLFSAVENPSDAEPAIVPNTSVNTAPSTAPGFNQNEMMFDNHKAQAELNNFLKKHPESSH
jgi:hypothetical protein